MEGFNDQSLTRRIGSCHHVEKRFLAGSQLSTSEVPFEYLARLHGNILSELEFVTDCGRDRRLHVLSLTARRSHGAPIKPGSNPKSC